MFPTCLGRGHLDEFKVIEINGMKLSHPTDAYTKLWSAISREEKPSQKALALLDRYFSKGSMDDRRLVVILMMDEMDYMVNRTHAKSFQALILFR